MARPKLGETATKRFQLPITEAELAAVKEWQHKNRIASQSEAIRLLIQRGLEIDAFMIHGGIV